MNTLGKCRSDPSQISWMLYFELTKKEIGELDLKAVGNLIFNRAVALNQTINRDLLEPISRWLGDSGFMDRFKESSGSHAIDWTRYKQDQRQWTKQQKMLAAERLRLYWQKIRNTQEFRVKLSEIISTNTQNRKTTHTQLHACSGIIQNILDPILLPFSPVEQRKAETLELFARAFSQPVSDLLPWKLLILSELHQSMKLSQLKAFYPEDKKKDTASKLMHLLQMQTDGQILLTQKQHLGEIQIEPLETDPETTVLIKDRHGLDYEFNWNELSDHQRTKVIADIKANKIICRQNNEKP